MKPSPSRILHVPRRFTEADWGGTETVLANLLLAQAAAGWRPEIHTSLALSSTPRELWRGLPVRRYRYCYPFFGLTSAQKLALDKKGGNLLSLSLLAGLTAARGVRLYHAHTLKRVGGTVRTAARLRGRPYVVTLHGGVFDVPAAEAASLVEPQQGKFEWGRPFGALLGSRRVLEEADAIICVGRTEAEKARAALPHDRIHHIGNGVDCDFFLGGDRAAFRSSHGIPPEACVVLCVSRIDPQKDQLCLVEAFDQLAPRHPALHLVIAGPATVPDYAASLRARIGASPHVSRIRILPPLAPGSAALADAFKGADVFALASRHEPFGIVVLEAWSAGLAVAASTAGGLADLIRDGETGLSFAPGDRAGCAAALLRLIGDPALRARLAAAGKTLARDRYAWSRIAEATEQVYQRAETHRRERR
jgi:glycosyltransferase involved in cell wall biosynthesis